MESSKSSGRVKTVVLALLALWSVVSLVIIVVWATSPDLKSSAQCRAELDELRVKMEGARVVFSQDRLALEEQVLEAREVQDRQRDQILELLGRINITNATLEQCQQQTVVLQGNITALQADIQLLRRREENLTAQISLQEDHIQALGQNVTQAVLQTESCLSLKAAADSQALAAQTQTRACVSSQQFLQKQLRRCKDPEPEAAPTQPAAVSPRSDATPLAAAPVLMLTLHALHLIT